MTRTDFNRSKRVFWAEPEDLSSLREALRQRDPIAIASTFQAVSPRDLLQHLLRHTDHAAIQHMCADSYRHTNGFDRLTLPYLSETDCVLRLHVWPYGSADADLHNHAWDFHSQIILGRLANVSHRVLPSSAPEDGPYRHYEHKSIEGGRAYSLTQCGSAAVVPSDEQVCRRGQAYQQSATTVHAVRTDKDITATLVLELPPSRDHSDVYVRAELTERTSAPVRRPRYSVAEVRSRLVQLSDLLRGRA